jgi:hypothetical protein
MLPIKHNKEPLGKGWEAHPTAFSMQHLGEASKRKDFPGYRRLWMGLIPIYCMGYIE